MAEGPRPKNQPRVPHRTQLGMKGLTVERASVLANERVRREHPELTGLDFSMQVAANMPQHMAQDLAAGMRFAREAVAAIRSAPDYDPAVHGSTDDEIAAYLQRLAEERRRV